MMTCSLNAMMYFMGQYNHFIGNGNNNDIKL